ncbi:phosphoribosyl-ATP diphosphatase [Acetobacter persici]|uniref:phosphoribosyl-ATP diphosphatase n=1 Tax=Acetobacter persici TaxID=1076596 RepID=UPI0020CBE7E4|nr:phosphoribosyl-ATP diphosphatase [Acetobacter persici]MCP9319360.1 phosphoribosyl-ATP diphosphatase [Acetobacter persici]
MTKKPSIKTPVKAPSKASTKAAHKSSPKKAAPAKKSVKAKEILEDTLSQSADETVLDRLYQVVLSRKGTDPSLSHSARLLSRGTYKVAQKFGEEAVECLIEAVAGRKDLLVGESADVLYHLIVLWVDAGVAPEDVWAELRRREGTSGIAEKASRSKENLSKKG